LNRDFLVQAAHSGIPDLSVLLTAHREATLLRRTIRSLAAAAHHAVAAGFRLELVVGLDRSDDPTRAALAACDLAVFADRQVLEIDAGDPGLNRNATLASAKGRLVTIADADDMVAPDLLTLTIAAADEFGPQTLVVPQWLICFGTEELVVENLPLHEVGARSLFGAHPSTSRICGHRAALEGRRYPATRPGTVYGFEDWHFNAEAVADGFDIRPAQGAVLFVRRRDDGRLATDRRAAVDVSPSRLFVPNVFAALPATPRSPPFDLVATRQRLLALPNLPSAIAATNGIDPAIQPSLVRRTRIIDNRRWLRPNLDAAYGDIAEIVGPRRFSEVFLLPFVSIGGADRYVEDVMRAMYVADPTRLILVLLGLPLAAGSDVIRVPPPAVVVDLAGDFPQLTDDERDLLTLRLIQSAAPGARIHMRPSEYVDSFFAAHGRRLGGHKLVYYRFGEPASVQDGEVFAESYGFHFVAEHLPRLTAIVADNPSVVRNDRERLGLWPERWHVLLSSRAPAVTEDEAAERAIRSKTRILWASRPDAEKRPELLRPLAAALARIAPELRIDAFGNSVLGGFDVASLAGIPNLTFHGSHAGFETLDHSAYGCFVHTSWFDGLPIVLLEAAAHGIPIIAPDVGGVGSFVIDGETGLLLPPLSDDGAMAKAYAAAIARLHSDSSLRVRLAVGAVRRLRERHAPEAHAAAVARVFGLEGST
jgi:glycosyltransferase involved in cell wall biosynthesis